MYPKKCNCISVFCIKSSYIYGKIKPYLGTCSSRPIEVLFFMNEAIHVIRQILSARRYIDTRTKFHMIFCCAMVIHFFFSVLMGLSGFTALAVYNLFASVFYFVMALLALRANSSILFFLVAYAEVEIHAAVATLCLGWDCGFMMYTIAMVPGGFYLENTLNGGLRKKFRLSMVLSMITAIIYVGASLIRFYNPLYPVVHGSHFSVIMFYFNTIVGYSMILIFSFLFALELQYFSRVLEAENSQLGVIANFDPLTRLLNRRGMSRQIDQAIEKANENEEETFTLIMADLDYFKQINDHYGHEVGDEVLSQVADILRNDTREEDLVCRWGGEEFLLLIRADEDGAYEIALRIQDTLARNNIKTQKAELPIRMTMGMARYQRDIALRDLINIADEKLYRGKENGRNQVVR